ncbi:universal stress protein [Robiginitalea aurantiaca]|uniref:Universal stress protein n=1 Tax=Robiginitalea aurantiaca TaxID=3056915 RepID=A0ABT7WD30_9FLAO|nr:universal stress protein [Robiginitalea aurantiaca]MDM9630714.1 universal stress protein [Robiginitalea aurantiaca]
MGFRIAIPTDFSENALKATRFAMELFAGEECTFYLTHTYTPAFYRAEYLLHSPGQIGLGDFYQERVLKKLEKHKKMLLQYADKKHEFMTHAAFNSLAEELNEMGKKEVLDLIVMGTQGATGAREVLFGTHAVQVLHKASCPVLVVPEGAEVSSMEHLLFPTDFKPDYEKLPLEALKFLLRKPGVFLHVLHAYTQADAKPERERGKAQLTELLTSYTWEMHETGEGDIVGAINRFAEQTPVQLLILVRNEHTFLENLLVTPLIDQIGFYTRIPFMVIPPSGVPQT